MLEEDDAVAQAMSTRTTKDCGGAKDVETKSTTRASLGADKRGRGHLRSFVHEHVKVVGNFHVCRVPVRVGSTRRTVRFGVGMWQALQVRVVEQ